MGYNGLDSVGVCSLDDGLGGGLSGIFDSGHFVANGGENDRKGGHKVWLDNGGQGGVGSDGLEGINGTLTRDGILLVGELLLQKIEDPVCVLARLHPLPNFVLCIETE
jgi:hypothetical protein